MVVFGTVSADVSPELYKVIPGDTAAKVAYLQEELQEHYPHVLITQQSCSIKVQGQWQEIIDLHSVLNQWYIAFLNTEKQRLEVSLQQAQSIQALQEDQPTVHHDQQPDQLEAINQAPPGHGHIANGTQVAESQTEDPLHQSIDAKEPLIDPDIYIKSSHQVQDAATVVYPFQTTIDTENGEDQHQNIPSGRQMSNITANRESQVILQHGTNRNVNDILVQASNDNVQPFLSSIQNAANMQDKSSESDGNTLQLTQGDYVMESKVNTSAMSSDLNTSDMDLEFADIKSFIKSWGGRMRDQEVQTDVPYLHSSSNPARRRGRKPGSPRKAKAHIPVRREPFSDRARTKPERFTADVASTSVNQSTPKRRRGRPKKNYADVLPEEMIPVPVPAGENVLHVDNEAFDQPPPSFDDIDLILDEKPRDPLNNPMLLDPLLAQDPNSAMVFPAPPGDDFQQNLSQRSAKAKAIVKVGVMAKEEEGLEIKEEKRGRKPKQGPCVSRDEIEAFLPTDDVFETGPYTCKLCPHISKKRAALKQHYLRCHLERKYQCRTCGKRYSMLKELATHKLTHNRRHQCQLCDKKFATQHLLEGHVERRHLNPKKKPMLVEEDTIANRQCPQCEFVAKSRKSLQDHMDRIHGEKIHPCPICNKMFALLKDLNQHIKFHSETYQCEECGKSLKSKLALKLHINGIHRGIKLAVKKEYVCEDCGKICRNKTHFKEHINKEHLHVKPYQCEICALAFFTKHALKCHGRVHSDIREFMCDFCGKGFKNRSGLRVHRITHQEVSTRPYVCGTCNKAFTQRGALVRHERIHSGDRPYKCRLCESSFNDYSILRRHVTGVHKINDRALCGRIDIDPNAINRGRPKMPGPVEHPDSEILNTQKQAEIMANAEKQAEMLAHAAMKVAQDIVQPAPLETVDATSAGIQNLAQHPPTFHTYVDNSLHRATPITQNIVHQQPGLKNEELVATSQVPTPTHTPGPKDLSLTQASSAHTSNQLQPVELITIGSDMGAPGHAQAIPLAAHQQPPAPHSSINSYTVPNMVPISVVSDMVQNVLYEHHHALEGGYTIGMPVFPTPTTVANMHMMQTLPPGQHTLTHLQPSSNPQNRGDRHTHM